MHIQYKLMWSYMHRNCTHKYTDGLMHQHTATHARKHSHAHTHTPTHKEHSSEMRCHIFVSTLERVDAVLSAELLEVLWDCVCGGRGVS